MPICKYILFLNEVLFEVLNIGLFRPGIQQSLYLENGPFSVKGVSPM